MTLLGSRRFYVADSSADYPDAHLNADAVLFDKALGEFFVAVGGSWAAEYTIAAVPAFATPSVVLGSSAAAGAASTVIRSDSTIAAFDVTVPVTQAFGDAAATGSAAKAARRDHVHGMPTGPLSAVSSYVSTYYYGPYAAPQSTPTTQSTATGFIRCVLVYIDHSVTFDQIAAEITTGSSGSIHLGIWGPVTSPFGSIANLFDSGDISVSAPAVKTAALTTFTIGPGWYLLGQENSATHTMRAWPAGGLPAQAFTTFGGTGRSRSYYFVAHTYGALPNPISGLATAGDSDLMPIIMLRAA